MINRVVLIGRITKDPEMKLTSNKKPVCSFDLAVNRNYTNNNGEREVDFIKNVCWGRTAENVSKYVGKGNLIAVEGRIQTRNYENNQGQKVYVTEVVADFVTFLESKRNDFQSENNVYISDDDLPF